MNSANTGTLASAAFRRERLRATRRVVAAALLLAGLGGCATGPDAHPSDPLEPFNRGVFAFNDDADRVIFRPAALFYRTLTPRLVRVGVGNFFGNLDDARSFVNSALQLKGEAAMRNFMRFSVNSTMGLGGILDVASEMRIERQHEDFGQTLGWWGVPPGPYLVLPFLGSSTLRDTAAMPVDVQSDIITNLDHKATRNAFKGLDLLNTRASLLSVTDALDEVALDKYSFVRDAHLQRRLNAVFDGNPPEDASNDAPPSR